MKNVLKLLLSAVILFAAVPTLNAADMNMAGMEEVKKKKVGISWEVVVPKL